VDVRDCLYLGDSHLDVLAARAGGAIAVAATWGVGGPAELAEAGPDITIDRIGDLVDFLETDTDGSAGGRHIPASGGVHSATGRCVDPASRPTYS